MSELLQQLSIAAKTLAARQIVHLANEVRCRECLRAAGDESALQHAEHCVVGIALVLCADVAEAKPMPCDAEIAEMLAARKTHCRFCGPKCLGGAAHNARTEDGCLYGQLPGESSEAVNVFAEPWRIATSAETDPCRNHAGALVNAEGELIASPRWMHVDYRHAGDTLRRIQECVNFFAGVPTLEIIGSGEMARERMAEVGGVGAAQGELCTDGATA